MLGESGSKACDNPKSQWIVSIRNNRNLTHNQNFIIVKKSTYFGELSGNILLSFERFRQFASSFALHPRAKVERSSNALSG